MTERRRRAVRRALAPGCRGARRRLRQRQALGPGPARRAADAAQPLSDAARDRRPHLLQQGSLDRRPGGRRGRLRVQLRRTEACVAAARAAGHRGARAPSGPGRGAGRRHPRGPPALQPARRTRRCSTASRGGPRCFEPVVRATRLFGDGQSLFGQVGIDVITGASPSGALPSGHRPDPHQRLGTGHHDPRRARFPDDLLPGPPGRAGRRAGCGRSGATSPPPSAFTPRARRTTSRSASTASSPFAVSRPALSPWTLGGGVNDDSVFPVGGTPHRALRRHRGLARSRARNGSASLLFGVSRVDHAALVAGARRLADVRERLPDRALQGDQPDGPGHRLPGRSADRQAALARVPAPLCC